MGGGRGPEGWTVVSYSKQAHTQSKHTCANKENGCAVTMIDGVCHIATTEGELGPATEWSPGKYPSVRGLRQDQAGLLRELKQAAWVPQLWQLRGCGGGRTEAAVGPALLLLSVESILYSKCDEKSLDRLMQLQRGH